MHNSVLAFARRVLTAEIVEGRRVLEVGSLDVNGSVRPIVEALRPASYTGIDQVPGPGVDLVRDAVGVEELGSFGLVISTEVLEHARDWRAVMRSTKAAVAPGGRLLVTTRGPGFGYHGYPTDEWRFTLAELGAMLDPFEVLELEPDPQSPGAFALAAWRHGPDHLDRIRPARAPNPEVWTTIGTPFSWVPRSETPPAVARIGGKCRHLGP